MTSRTGASEKLANPRKSISPLKSKAIHPAWTPLQARRETSALDRATQPSEQFLQRMAGTAQSTGRGMN